MIEIYVKCKTFDESRKQIKKYSINPACIEVMKGAQYI